MNREAIIGAVALLGLAAAGETCADAYHYRNMLIGDRAAGLGGAYTAVSDDPSGLFYNPAGVVYAGDNRLSASVNAYHTTTTTYKDVLGGGNWTRRSQSLLPNFFGVVQQLGAGYLGFSYAVTDSILENQDQRLTSVGNLSEFVLNVNNQDNTYKLGPSYAVPLRNNLSIGGTLYFHLRDSETVVNQESYLLDSSYAWQNSYLQIKEQGVEPVLGIMWSPVERLAFGLTLRKTFVLSSDGRAQITCASDVVSACASTKPSYTLGTFDTKRDYPLSMALGAAWFPSDKLLYSADFIYYGETNGQESSRVDSPFRTRAATWNASIGAEYYFSRSWALRGGLYTNRANTPGVSSDRTGQPEHIDLVGLSATLTRFTRSSSISGGVSYSAGNGKAQAIEGVTDVQQATQSELTLFLSTSYSF